LFWSYGSCQLKYKELANKYGILPVRRNGRGESTKKFLKVGLVVLLVLVFSAYSLNAAYGKEAPSGSGSISISNNILKVIIEDVSGTSGIGTFTIKTDAGHPNPGQNVFYDGAIENPWSTFTTIRVEDTLKEYVTSTESKTPSIGYTVEYLDNYSPVVTVVSATRATISWTTAESLSVTLLIDIRGTTVADTMVEVTVTIENADTAAHSVAVRHEWDLTIDGSDDSWIRVWTDPSTPQSWTETETDWVSPAFQFWETTNDPAAPVFSVYGSTELPLVNPPPTVPDRFVYAYWWDAYRTAYDFTPSGLSGMDSAVVYYWNAEEISPGGGQISRTAYVTTVVQEELESFAWSCDSGGNSKPIFEQSDNVYVRGRDFPPDTDVTIYLIPDGTEALPANAVADASTTTNSTGGLPATSVWSQPLTSGEYDIWVDVNQNEVFDAGDVWNNQVGGIYAFSVIPPSVATHDLTVHVVDSTTTNPIPGATVTTSAPDPRSDTTDGTGTVVFLDILEGDYEVLASKTGYDPASQMVEITGDTEITIYLRPLDEVPPPPVGGLEAPLNTLALLAPWIILALATSFGAILATKRKTKH